jgi:putative ABC transport system permease protein
MTTSLPDKLFETWVKPKIKANLLPGTGLLAWRNLVHERPRFIVTLTGIVFSVVLMGIQLGLLIGFCLTTSGIIDNTDADIWITPKGTSNVDIAGLQATRWRQQALALPEVAAADLYLMQFSLWHKPSGGSEGVMLVGFNLATGRGGPWALEEGRMEDLQQDDAVIIDRLYADKLKVSKIGEIIEINSRRARIVGFTHRIRTFTQTPYVFTTYRNALSFSRIPDDQTSYVLLKLKPGADLDKVVATLRAQVPMVDVWSKSEWTVRTRMYWMVTTGAGAALLLAAALGLIVGIVIVGQTLYASTVDRIAEYATLRAMGAPNKYLYSVILKQAMFSAVLGFLFGITITLLASWQSRGSNVPIIMPWWAVLVVALLTVLMCLAGAVASIRRVLVLDPSSVFK